MKFFIVFSAIVAVALGHPGFLYGAQPAPLAYASFAPGAPIGLDGRVIDTPEVSVAKAEHAAAHANERIALANEAAKSAEIVVPAASYGYASLGSPILAAHSPIVSVAATKFLSGAPIGLDGRVVDTPEVSLAKAEHAAAHANERLGLAHQEAKAASADLPLLVSSPLAYANYH